MNDHLPAPLRFALNGLWNAQQSASLRKKQLDPIEHAERYGEHPDDMRAEARAEIDREFGREEL